MHDAGLVLLHPYLPRLFAQTGVLGEDRIVPGREDKAGALLQYAASGNPATPARLSPLVLLLCGLATDAEVHGDTLTPEDRHVADSMIEALRQNWSVVRGSSVTGLRETFLQREGRLDPPTADRVDLRVHRKPLDILIDQIPWSIAVVSHPWMPRALHVSW